MDMEIVRLANTSWLQVPDRLASIVRAVSRSSDGPQARSGGSAAEILLRVPMLDWPSTLFDDEMLYR